MKNSRVLDNAISYCLMTAALGLLLFLIYPLQTAECLKSLNPFVTHKNIYKSATGNYVSNGMMSADSEPIPPAPADQKAVITGNLAKDWQDWSGWADLTAHYEVDSNNCRNSGSCQRIDIPRINSGYLTFAHWLRLPAGAYAGDLWLRSSSRSAVIIAVKNSDDSSGMQQFDQKLLVGPDWKHVELSGRCPGWDNAAVTVSVLSGGASLWIADVRLERRFDWISLLLILAVVAGGIGMSHLFDFIIARLLTAKKRQAHP